VRSRAGALALLVTLCAGALGLAAPATPTADAAPAAPARTAAVADDAPVSVRLDALAPRMVTADGPPELIVTGRVANRSAVPVRDLGVRLQRGAPVSGQRDTLASLDGTEPAEDVRPDFTEIAPILDPGDDLPFTLRVPVSGAPTASLAIASPGVYPLLLNANGTLGTAGPARLGAVRLLLPVVGLPGSAPAPAPDAAGTATVSVLYPIADRPRRLPVVPGAPTVLSDDDLATSLAPGGRLAGLVDALGRSAPLGSAAARSVCVAVDADLLETATAMAGGYEVRTGDSAPVAGRGAAAAAQWLDALRGQVRGRCVLALPYADTDLVATSRGNLTDLTTAAGTLGARRVAEILGATPVPGASWPADGDVDERTVADLTTGGTRALLLDAQVLEGGVPDGGVARLTGSPATAPLAVGLDPIAQAALAPRDADDDADDAGPAATGSVGTSPAGTAAPLSTQDAVGTLALRALQKTSTGETPPVTVVAPPRRWEAGPAEAGAYLDAVNDLSRLGLVRPVDLGSLLGQAATAPGLATRALTASSTDAPGLGEAAVARAGAVRDRQRDLLAATEQDALGSPSPSDFVEPLTEGLLRSLSAAWRGNPGAEDAAIAGMETQTDTLRSMVRVVQPAGSYSLGSNDAPLLVTVENRLPVAVRVQVELAPTPGLRTAPLPVDSVPAFGSRQFQVGVEVVRAGQFSVDAQARTPGGEALGPTARLLLRSTAYGTITVWLTASAAVVLVILASVRIVRRVRASRRDRRSRRSRRRGGPPWTGPAGPGGPTDPTEPWSRELQSR
jgi:hypothetical protein